MNEVQFVLQNLLFSFSSKSLSLPRLFQNSTCHSCYISIIWAGLACSKSLVPSNKSRLRSEYHKVLGSSQKNRNSSVSSCYNFTALIMPIFKPLAGLERARVQKSLVGSVISSETLFNLHRCILTISKKTGWINLGLVAFSSSTPTIFQRILGRNNFCAFLSIKTVHIVYHSE